MTDVQILTIVIALATSFLAVLMGVLLNNTRLSDLRASLDHRITDSGESVRAQIDASNAELRFLIEKNHSETMLKLADLDTRLSRIEQERRIVQ
jgi:hypothetical protein